MRKVVVTFIIVQLMFLTGAPCYSASDRCVVKKTEGNTVVLSCSKKSGNFKVNDKVKVKTDRKKSK